MSLRASTIVVLLIAWLTGSPARAQKSVALEHYRRGVALVQRGELRQAITAFERSLAAYAHDNTLYALGEAHRRLGRLRQSFHYYSRYAEHLEGAAREAFLAKLRKLRDDAVSTLTVSTSPPGATIWIDGRSAGKALPSLRVEVRAGRHRLRATLRGHHEVHVPLTAAFGEPANLHLQLAPSPEPSASAPPPPIVEARPPRSPRPGAWYVGISAGPSLASYGDSSLSVGASVDAQLDGGYLWQLGRFVVTLGLSVEVAPVTDTIADDRAAFVTLLPGVSGRFLLGHGLWLEGRVGLGLCLLAGAGEESFLVRGAEPRDVYLGLALQPALRIGWRLWRGLALIVTPGALAYSPRVGGFAELAPGVGTVLRYHGAVGLAWTFGRAGER